MPERPDLDRWLGEADRVLADEPDVFSYKDAMTVRFAEDGEPSVSWGSRPMPPSPYLRDLFPVIRMDYRPIDYPVGFQFSVDHGVLVQIPPVVRVARWRRAASIASQIWARAIEAMVHQQTERNT